MTEKRDVTALPLGEVPVDDRGRLPRNYTRHRDTRRYADAVRARRATLRRHDGYDGPTVCACTECVLWSLLDGVLSELAAES